MIGLTLALVAGVLAAPTCPSIEQNANFDDEPAPISSALEPVPVGYRGLFFQGFNINQDLNTGTLPGLEAHSPPNVAGATLLTETRAGTPMITTNYPGTNTTSFSLESFFFGCNTNLDNGITAPPQSCIINIAGYRGNDNQVSAAQQVCAKQFQYNPSTILGGQQLAFTGPISCPDVQFVIFTFTPQGGEAATASDLALFVDDVKFSSRGC